ncbi:hypothetical protein EH221_04110 [bacterium]|nr:MAG: hypothetical protein EH221_04110 [bacterium]
MNNINSILCCLLMAGCATENNYRENLSCQGGHRSLKQVETITKFGDFVIPHFFADKQYTGHIIPNTDRAYPNKKDDYWIEDCFLLILTDETGQRIVGHFFHSSYGVFEIEFVDLTGDEKKEVVFILGEGRGTSARREMLTVYEVAECGLRQLYTTQYSDYYGSGSRWWYERCYKDTDYDGIVDLELNLSYDPIGQTNLETPELIPNETLKVFR